MTRYRIPELASKYMSYDMIQRYAGLPDFPESRIHLLFLFLSQQRFAAASSEMYALAVSLVQLGLDTHDRVDTELGERGIQEMRVRQLRVLAGDYFSSRFYQLLAAAGQIDMIRRLSGTICEANRLKTDLYLKAKGKLLTGEEYLDQHAGIRSVLFDTFTMLLEEKIRPLWSELLHTLTQMEVLREERDGWEQNKPFTGSWGYWHVLESGSEEERAVLRAGGELDPGFVQGLLERYPISSMLGDMLGACAEKFRRLARKLESERLVDEVLSIGERLLQPSMAPELSRVTGEMR